MIFCEVRQFAEQLAREAGALVKRAHQSRDKQVECKNELGTDLVTQTDREVEELIKERIKAAYPNHWFVGEESSREHAIHCNGGCWMVDPIDGTTNFVHGQVNVAISIGWCWEGIPTVGVIYNPILDYLFSASLGHGAHLNGHPIQVSSCTSLHQALIHTEFGVLMSDISRKQHQMNLLINYPVHAIRMHGSAAMALCWVAMGVAEAYFERGIKAWDIAAGTVIVREAGGHVGGFTDQHYELAGGEVVACCNEQIRNELLSLIEGSSPLSQ